MVFQPDMNVFSFFFPALALQCYVSEMAAHPKGALTKLHACVSPCVYVRVPVCTHAYVCVTLSEAFLFNHLREISNIPLKLNMKGNLLYFYSLSLHREPGNYLFHFASDSWKAHGWRQREREREKEDGDREK